MELGKNGIRRNWIVSRTEIGETENPPISLGPTHEFIVNISFISDNNFVICDHRRLGVIQIQYWEQHIHRFTEVAYSELS